MKLRRLFCGLLASLSIVSLTGCGGAKKHDISEYVLKLDYKDDFKILQLSDIHISNKDNRARQFEFIGKTIEMADADFIVLTGDTFTFGDRRTARELVNFLDSYKTPWTLTFGNHDEQCYFSIDWLTSYLNELSDSNDSYCIFKDIQDDDVMGNANFAINLMDGNSIKEQIIIMDSNRYHYGYYIGYDYFKQNQIDWYSDLVDYTTSKNNGKVVDSIMFFHIPLPEWVDAVNGIETGETELLTGVMGESPSVPQYNSGFFDVILSKGSTKSMNVGHDHVDNLVMKYKGIYLAYGVNSSDRIYFDEGLIGGSVITIHNDNSLSYDHIIRSYDEYK